MMIIPLATATAPLSSALDPQHAHQQQRVRWLLSELSFGSSSSSSASSSSMESEEEEEEEEERTSPLHQQQQQHSPKSDSDNSRTNDDDDATLTTTTTTSLEDEEDETSFSCWLTASSRSSLQSLDAEANSHHDNNNNNDKNKTTPARGVSFALECNEYYTSIEEEEEETSNAKDDSSSDSSFSQRWYSGHDYQRFRADLATHARHFLREERGAKGQRFSFGKLLQKLYQKHEHGTALSSSCQHSTRALKQYYRFEEMEQDDTANANNNNTNDTSASRIGLERRLCATLSYGAIHRLQQQWQILSAYQNDQALEWLYSNSNDDDDDEDSIFWHDDKTTSLYHQQQESVARALRNISASSRHLAQIVAQAQWDATRGRCRSESPTSPRQRHASLRARACRSLTPPPSGSRQGQQAADV